jgi:hypothetical protein
MEENGKMLPTFANLKCKKVPIVLNPSFSVKMENGIPLRLSRIHSFSLVGLIVPN